MTKDMADLAERCEQATGPDRELDYAIADSVLGTVKPPYRRGRCDRYTASLDAAMSLVPEGWVMAALCQREPWFCRLETDDFDSMTFGKGEDWITEITAGQEAMATAATPALALCAASLRARAAALKAKATVSREGK